MAQLGTKARLGIFLLVVLTVISWITIGSLFLKLTSFFASFLFLWQWANSFGADFGKVPECVLGGLFGTALSWQAQILPAAMPDIGLFLTIGIIAVAVFIQIMNWIPLVVNSSAMLFLTALTAPALLTTLDFGEVAVAVTAGAAYFATIIYVLKMALQRIRRFNT